MATQRIENKVAIVTGGASGIGEATARSFAENGALAVVIADVQEEKGQQVAESIGLHRCTYIKCNVADEAQVKNLVDSTLKKYGQLDIMFSNAGIVSRSKQDTLDFDLKDYEALFAVNVGGMISCIKHAGRAMVDGGIMGSIICTASIMANHSGVSMIDYVMSKYAVLGLVRCASKGLGQHGIRVNCVSPSPIATPIYEQVMPGISVEELEKHFESVTDLKNGGVLKVKHVADAVMFLASQESEFVTGQNLVIDGGYYPFKDLSISSN